MIQALPEPLRADLVEALAQLLITDLEQYPVLPADAGDEVPEGARAS